MKKGFTIVELLIVIVVIGILAGISIVAYSGIQNRAKAAAAQSASTQVTKKIQTYAIENNDLYPADLATIGVHNTTDTSYQYSYDNTAKTYCVTTTNQNISYYQNNTTQTAPAAGGCPGHGVGGVGAITNLVTNPSMETDINGYGFNAGSLGTRFQSSAAAYSGSYGQRFSVSTNGNVGNSGPYIQVLNLSEYESYTASVWIRSSVSIPYSIQIERRNSAGTNIGNISSNVVTLTPNTWTRLSVTIPATPTMVRFTFCVYSGAGSVVTGDTVDYDGLMVTVGSTLYTYADGSSPNWVWNGTSNASTSTGPPL